MTNRLATPLRIALVLFAVLAWTVPHATAETLFEDEFEFFELGETWQEHGAGAPDLGLDVGFADDSEVLQMSSSNFADEFRGIETISPISLVGLSDLTVDAHLRPLIKALKERSPLRKSP